MQSLQERRKEKLEGKQQQRIHSMQRQTNNAQLINNPSLVIDNPEADISIHEFIHNIQGQLPCAQLVNNPSPVISMQNFMTNMFQAESQMQEEFEDSQLVNNPNPQQSSEQAQPQMQGQPTLTQRLQLLTLQSEIELGFIRWQNRSQQPMQAQPTYKQLVNNLSNYNQQQISAQPQMQFAQPTFTQWVDNPKQQQIQERNLQQDILDIGNPSNQKRKVMSYQQIAEQAQSSEMQGQPVERESTFAQLINTQNQQQIPAQPQMQGQPTYAQWINNQNQSSNNQEQQR